MRQITLKNIRASLTKELNNLPFEITKNGKVIAMVCENGLNTLEKGLNSNPKSSPNHVIDENPVEAAKVKLVDIVNKKTEVKPFESPPATGVRLEFRPFSKAQQCRKKVK